MSDNKLRHVLIKLTTDFVGTINVAFHVEADWVDQLKACYHAEVIEYCFSVAQHTAVVRYLLLL